MNSGEEIYHKESVMVKDRGNADVAIPTEELLDVMDCIYAVDASTRLEKT